MNGKNLKQLRQQKGISQAELARAVGVWQTMISQIETGEKAGSLDLAIRLADYFDVSLDELARDEESIAA